MNKYLDTEAKKTGDVCKSPKNKFTDKIFVSLNDLDEVAKRKQALHLINEIYKNFFDTESLQNYASYTKEKQQYSDESDICTIIKYDGKDTIVKVGCWEFNTQVFTTSGVPELRSFYRSPIPLFVLNQSGPEESIQKQTQPKQYLNECAIIVVPKWWEAYARGPREREKGIDYGPIHIRHYEDALVTGRLALLQKTFPNGQFQKAVDILSKRQGLAFDAFYNRIYKNASYLSDNENEKKLLWCLWDMGINKVGSVVGDKAAYQSLYDLIQSFDTHKEVFTLPSHHHE